VPHSMLTSPSFLLANPVNADLSVILLDVLHSMLQYQTDGAATELRAACFCFFVYEGGQAEGGGRARGWPACRQC
jgi:hypothetical protein